MFTEVPNPKTPKLHHLDFLVDYKLKDIAPPFPSIHSYMVFLGASRSGKTSLWPSEARQWYSERQEEDRT